jgi:nitronate monooxygenase/enoyl-[acyl-carrier protein] reductase II
VSPIPVVAAGGISDGRGLAAALVLGAQGANIGSRFLASNEASIGDSWKKRIVEATSVDAVKVELWDEIFPKPGADAFDVVPRALRTRFIDEWQDRRAEAAGEAERLQGDIWSGIQQGRMEDFVPFTGQSAGLVHEILPAGEIVHRLVQEAEEALRRAAAYPIVPPVGNPQ